MGDDLSDASRCEHFGHDWEVVDVTDDQTTLVCEHCGAETWEDHDE